MSSIGFQRLFILQYINKDERRSYQDEFIRHDESNMKNGFIQGLLSFDDLVLGGAIIYPEAESD